jgi:hypothetical protein
MQNDKCKAIDLHFGLYVLKQQPKNPHTPPPPKKTTKNKKTTTTTTKKLTVHLS